MSQRRQRGFTLIELMIVVVIVGVLATLATYSVNNYLQTTKTAEAREVVGSIMAAQEAFFDETSRYLDVTGGVTDNDFYPDATFKGTTVVQWGSDDGCTGVDFGGGATPPTCAANFRTLGVFVNTPVRFRYASTVFAANAAPPLPSTYVSGYNPDGVKGRRPGYVVVALSDLDGDGGERSAVVGSSLQAQIYGENLGE